MIKVVSFKICPFVQRVTALLEAKQIPYALEFIQLSDKPDWFLEISPTGQVPVLITERGEVLFESDAIVEYLEEVTPPLVADVTPEQRAKDRAWSYLGTKNYLVQCATMQSADQSTLLDRRVKLDKVFGKVEAQLGDGPYFNGPDLSNVDIAWLPLLHRSMLVKRHSGYDFFADYPKIQAWQQAIDETGLSEKTVSEDFEDLFSRFYLSERTFLGRGADFEEVITDDHPAKLSGGCCG